MDFVEGQTLRTLLMPYAQYGARRWLRADPVRQRRQRGRRLRCSAGTMSIGLLTNPRGARPSPTSCWTSTPTAGSGCSRTSGLANGWGRGAVQPQTRAALRRVRGWPRGDRTHATLRRHGDIVAGLHRDGHPQPGAVRSGRNRGVGRALAVRPPAEDPRCRPATPVHAAQRAAETEKAPIPWLNCLLPLLMRRS